MVSCKIGNYRGKLLALCAGIGPTVAVGVVVIRAKSAERRGMLVVD